MRLNAKELSDKRRWEQAGYRLPRYDVEAVKERTRRQPVWIHFGAGNIFRAFAADILQKMLNAGKADFGLTAVEGYDYEIIQKVYRPVDNYCILASLKPNGIIEKTVIGSVVESLILDKDNEPEWARLMEIFAGASLQMATFTITEKGYRIFHTDGKPLPEAECDMQAGPKDARSYIGKVAALLYARFLAGQYPIAMVSMDNCSYNGDRLRDAVCAFAAAWESRGLVEHGFTDYINNPSKVSFPWTMIDKITPRPDPGVKKILDDDGLEGMEPVVTKKSTYTAPFVNAEECGYLVVEDDFPNGRPRLEEGGVLFADKDTVEKAEKMKVCTCLNPLHTALAVFGCLLGYERISDEMADEQLRRLLECIGYEEGLAAAADPGILNPRTFLDTVLNERLTNPYLPDTPQRIAVDTSQKLAVRFGETIKAYQNSDTLDTSCLQKIPLVLAGWLRYLTGIADDGKSFALSPDPLAGELRQYVKDAKFYDVYTVEQLKPLLADQAVFGVDLCAAGLAERVTGCFNEMLRGKGAVRAVLTKYTAQES